MTIMKLEIEVSMTQIIVTTSNVHLLSEQPGWWDSLLLGDEYDNPNEDQGSRLRGDAKKLGDRSASPPDSSLIWGSPGHSGWI